MNILIVLFPLVSDTFPLVAPSLIGDTASQILKQLVNTTE